MTASYYAPVLFLRVDAVILCGNKRLSEPVCFGTRKKKTAKQNDTKEEATDEVWKKTSLCKIKQKCTFSRRVFRRSLVHLALVTGRQVFFFFFNIYHLSKER